MASAVRDHRIAQAVFAVQPSKQQPDAAVEQKAPEENHRRQSHHRRRCRQMSRCKQQRREHIGKDQNPRSYLPFPLPKSFCSTYAINDIMNRRSMTSSITAPYITEARMNTAVGFTR